MCVHKTNEFNMKYALVSSTDSLQIVELFTQVFSESEGSSEGQIIGNLVSNLMARTTPQDLVGCAAFDNDRIMGCIFFSRFIVPSNELAFILSPVAVSTEVQGSGVGQQLIRYGINHLKSLDVNLVFTYGDPAYYSKTGFEKLSEEIVKAPYSLSQPIGWLAQSLDGRKIQAMEGSTQCVEALSNPQYW